jgi:hypothetical protein
MPTTPPSITALPAAPDPNDRSTFNARAYPWSAALNNFGTQLSAVAATVKANADEAEADASSAATARTAAEQAQAAAEAASAASKWISGTTYAEGVVVWSPADFASYRRKSTGAGTIDPSADSANWAKLGASAALNGSQTLTTSTTLTASSPAVNLLAFTAHGGSVTMPNATTMTAGGCKFILDNSAGQFPVGVLNGAGQVMGQVLPGDSIQLHLTSAATAAGVWRHSGNFDPVWITNEIGLSLTRPGGGAASILPIDATRCLVHWGQFSTGFPMCRIVTWTSPTATPTVSAEITLRAASDSLTDIIPIGASRALLRFSSNNCVVMDTTAATVGSAVSVTFTAGSSIQLRGLDSQYAVLMAIDGTANVVRARCIDCGASGTALTAGAEVASATFGGSGGDFWLSPTQGGIQAVSSTVIGVVGLSDAGGYYNYWAYAINRTSGTTLSFSANAGTPASSRTTDTTQNTSQLHPLTASTALLWYWSNTTVRYVVITFAAGSATWGTSVASNALTGAGNVIIFAASPDRTRFAAAQCIANSTCNIEAITVSGATVAVGASTSFSAETAPVSPSIVLHVTNEGRGLIYWRGQAWQTGSADKLRLFTLSGTAFTFGAEASSTNYGSLGSMTTYSLQSLQQYSRNNLFAINGGSGSPGMFRAIVFEITAGAAMNVLAEVEAPNQAGFFQPRAGTDGNMLLWFGQSAVEEVRVFVNATNKRVQKARAPAYRLNASMTNGQSDWSNLQRPTGLGLLSHYTVPGSNTVLQTHRICEV